ncbi:hypothetical protein AGMMS50230_08730 [Spirochaetia bacterium]|nr:hypothetical protein AGMMS50230_08730 [Spirochaetia bacterium]
MADFGMDAADFGMDAAGFGMDAAGSGMDAAGSGMDAAELLCIGNAMVDVFAEIPKTRFGNFCEDFGLSKPVQHVPAETAAAILAALPAVPPPVYCAGGGAANTAKIAARLGVKTAFAGAVGGLSIPGGEHTDRFGTLFEKELRCAGVELYLARKQSPTGMFISLTSGGERRIAASPAAALELETADINEDLFSGKSAAHTQHNSCGTPKILMLEGFLLERENLLRRLLELAEKHSLTLALDPGTADNATEHAALICSLSSHFPVILFMNENEAAAFAPDKKNLPPAGLLPPGPKPGFPLLVVKCAERGAVVSQNNTMWTIPTQPVEGAESTGAGDAFAAGFLAAWLRGQNPEVCGKAGNAAAALVLERPGTGNG